MRKRLQNKAEIIDVLRAGGFRATTSRINLLMLLEKIGSPLSIQKIARLWEGDAPDITTLYRSLTDLSTARIVRRIDLNTGIAHFEYTPNRPHHHHIVCKNCGRVEELKQCPVHEAEKQILQTTKYFSYVYAHSLEFFGTCTTCAQ